MFEIDEIILQAQTNIEQFETELTAQVQHTVRTARMESAGNLNEVTCSSGIDIVATESVDSVDSIEPNFWPEEARRNVQQLLPELPSAPKSNTAQTIVQIRWTLSVPSRSTRSIPPRTERI